MNDEINTQDTPREDMPGHGPGERLRAARVQRELSVEQVGQRLNLEARQVRALEEDDWARLPEPIYVAGYLRNYARLLGLPEQEIVNAYPHRPREPFEPSGPVAPVKTGSEPVGGKVLGVIALVLVIAAMVAIVLWYLGRFETEREVPPMPEPTETPATQGQGPGSSPEETAAVQEPGSPPEETIAVQEPEPAADSFPAEEPESLPTLAPRATPAPPVDTAATVVEEPAVLPTSVPARAVEPKPEQAQGRLVLRFTMDSWTEVADATGRSLAYDLVRGGNTLELEGVPPLRVFLGYAPGVTVEYNGEPVESGRYTRDDVARFSVGRSAAAAR